MRAGVANRKIHYWLGFAFALPVLVIVSSGLLLQVKKQSAWVQPPTMRGYCEVPALSFEAMLSELQQQEALGVTGWSSIDRVDVRPDRCLAKVQLKNRYEVQLDMATGDVLQVAYRRSDLIESLHDGSFFGGDLTKLALFLPAGVSLLVLWVSGMWMFFQPFAARRRQRERFAQSNTPARRKPAA
jgi:uncharacterized iron-regulated membrane protein